MNSIFPGNEFTIFEAAMFHRVVVIKHIGSSYLSFICLSVCLFSLVSVTLFLFIFIIISFCLFLLFHFYPHIRLSIPFVSSSFPTYIVFFSFFFLSPSSFLFACISLSLVLFSYISSFAFFYLRFCLNSTFFSLTVSY